MERKPRVDIPGILHDASFNEIVSGFLEVMDLTENYGQETDWILREGTEYNPVLLMILSLYRNSMGNSVTCLLEEKDGNFREDSRITVTEYEILNDYKSFMTSLTDEEIFLIDIPAQGQLSEELHSSFLELICGRVLKNGKCINRSYLSYLIGEITDNVREHSSATRERIGFCYSKELNRLYLCFSDNGRTILGSYLSSGRRDYLERIGGDSAKAVLCSTEGLSTKNRPEAENRGYGLSTNISIVRNAFNGGFLIFSGDSIFFSIPERMQTAKLPPHLSWDGTLILLDIPLRDFPMEEFYKYLDH